MEGANDGLSQFGVYKENQLQNDTFLFKTTKKQVYRQATSWPLNIKKGLNDSKTHPFAY